MARARIYRPAKNAMQSGTARTRRWVLDYELPTPRIPDPLMGWSSAGDTLNEVQLHFRTLDEAIAYAKKKGLDYTVIEPKDEVIRPKSYADNFRYNRPA
jgi:ETC complex I subunit-like protein